MVGGDNPSATLLWPLAPLIVGGDSTEYSPEILMLPTPCNCPNCNPSVDPQELQHLVERYHNFPAYNLVPINSYDMWRLVGDKVVHCVNGTWYQVTEFVNDPTYITDEMREAEKHLPLHLQRQPMLKIGDTYYEAATLAGSLFRWNGLRLVTPPGIRLDVWYQIQTAIFNSYGPRLQDIIKDIGAAAETAVRNQSREPVDDTPDRKATPPSHPPIPANYYPLAEALSTMTRNVFGEPCRGHIVPRHDSPTGWCIICYTTPPQGSYGPLDPARKRWFDELVAEFPKLIPGEVELRVRERGATSGGTSFPLRASDE
jgi:hypothetical protein